MISCVTVTDAAPAVSLLTYPARPINGGPPHLALRKFGEWIFEPKVNGWRMLVHAPTGTCWNRHGQPLSIAAEFEPALRTVRRLPWEWIDCEGLERRHGIGRGTIIVLDVPSWAQQTWTQRRGRIDANPGYAPELKLGEPIESNAVYALPFFPIAEMAERCEQMKAINRQLGCVFYEGVVAKKAHSTYPIQLHSPEKEFPQWMKHRFI